jgi:hypothetical protein
MTVSGGVRVVTDLIFLGKNLDSKMKMHRPLDKNGLGPIYFHG